MQSFIQYRRFGRKVEEQIERDKRKNQIISKKDLSEPSSSQHETAATKDLEKGDSSPDPQSAEHQEEFEEVEAYEEASSPLDKPESLESGEDPPSPDVHVTNVIRPNISRATTARSNESMGTKLGLTLTGIDVRDRTTKEGGNPNRQVFVVGYEGPNDPLNPHNWSNWIRFRSTIFIAFIGGIVGFASSIDASIVRNAADEFGVSIITESLATGLYLAGFGVGALVAGPFSETLGRNPVYVVTLSCFMVFVMASGLAPNIGAQLAFRFLAGFFGSTPLTCAGGSLADLWSPLERVFAFPVFANAAFMGPILGPVVGGFVADSPLVSWRWTEWITLCIAGLVLSCIILFQPETYPGILLHWKAAHLRRVTGDDRYRAPLEIREDTLGHRLITALYRPFIMTAQEPIIILISLYLTVIYVIIFTFLDGYAFIFGDVHGLSPSLTGLCFLGIALGLCLCTAMVPLIYKWAKAEMRRIEASGGDKLPPEFRLWFAMLGGAWAIPISLFWMGWTSYPSISIWSPLIASVLFGFGVLAVFISCYQYIIDSYELFAASGLASVTLIRYLASGGMTVVGFPFYENLGVHYTLTILACISLAMAPVPYVFYKYGPKIRAYSKYAPTPLT